MTQKFDDYFSGAQEMTLVGPTFEPTELERFSHKAHDIIFIDGGSHYKQSFKSNKSLSIGDGDSFDGVLDILAPTHKDRSDLSLALDFIPGTCTKIHLYGLLGRRSDHELAVLGELYFFIKKRPSLTKVHCYHSHKSWLMLPKGHHSLKNIGHFSLFTLDDQNISLTGDLTYQATNAPFKALSSFGLSNSSRGAFEVTSEAPVVIIQENHDQ